MNQTIVKGAAAVGAVAALVFGAAAISGADSNSPQSGTQGGLGGAPNGAPPQMQQPQQDGTQQQRQAPPGFGTEVTGTTAAKVKAAALAKAKGTIEHIVQLPDGSYVAHVIRSDGSGETHVFVSKAFKVTGTETGGPRGGRGFPGGAPPQGAAPQTSSGATTKS